MDLGIVRRIEGDNYTVIAAGGPQRSGSMRLVAMVPSVVTLGGFSYSFVQHRVTSLPLVAPNPQLIPIHVGTHRNRHQVDTSL